MPRARRKNPHAKDPGRVSAENPPGATPKRRNPHAKDLDRILYQFVTEEANEDVPFKEIAATLDRHAQTAIDDVRHLRESAIKNMQPVIDMMNSGGSDVFPTDAVKKALKGILDDNRRRHG